MGVLQSHAKGRGLAAGAVALVAIAIRLSSAAPPPRSIEGVAEALGKAAGGAVRPDDFLWEGRAGFLEETFLGRRILFLASPVEGGPRDLYRARVRLTRGGRPISVSGVRNITRTSDGDERDLLGAGHHVAFATQTLDGVQGVTLLDLEGAPLPAAAPASGVPGAIGAMFARGLAAADRWRATGSARGLARTEIAFAEAPPQARFEVAQGALVLALGEEAIPAALDFATLTLQTGRTNPFAASAQPVPEPVRPAPDVLADLLGPRGAAVRGLLARAPSVLGPSLAPAPPPGPRIAASYPSEGGWPPAPLVPPHPTPFDGEGYWHVSPSMQAEAQQVPPPMVETIIRPDPDDRTAIVHLVAIDTRRLDVRILPGAASPRPTTGPRGSGMVPRGPGAPRAVAAFVAGPSPAPRQLGFLGEGRVLAPFVAGAPSLAVRPDGEVVLGRWPADASRDGFVAIAQAPDALPEAAGAPAAAGGPAASFAPIGAGARVGRAALCRTKDGYLVHAFATSSSAASLGAGLALAGCTSALHLGVSPAPLGLAYLQAPPAPSAPGAAAPAGADQAPPALTGTLAAAAMTMPLDALAGPWLQPLGLVTARAHGPSGSVKNAEWAPDAGAQPPPAWHPAVFLAETEQLGAKVRVHAFLPDRFRYHLAAGKDESVSTRGDKPGLPAAERASALAALGMSVARRGHRRGLIIGGAQAARPGTGAVWLSFDGARASISAPGAPPPASGDATEVTLIAEERALLKAAREVGTHRPRTALCVLSDGTLLVAHASFDTDEATAEVLLDAGCARIVSLDRGAHDGVFLHRAGTDRAPEAEYEATVLYVTGVAETGTARDF